MILRFNAPDSVAFGVNRNREAAILALISEFPWAPDVVANDPQAGWLLMDWHGERLSAPLGEPEQSQLLTSVAQWQTISSDDPELQIDYQALFDTFRPQVKDLPMEQPLLTLIDGALRALDSLPNVESILTHHDLHPGNLCSDNVDVWLWWTGSMAQSATPGSIWPHSTSTVGSRLNNWRCCPW